MNTTEMEEYTYSLCEPEFTSSVVIVETENEPLYERLCMKVMNLIVKISLMNLWKLNLNLNNPRPCIISINVY